MARISGVDLPRNKRVDIGLTYVFGIGRISAKKIIAGTSIDPSTRCNNLTDEEIMESKPINGPPISGPPISQTINQPAIIETVYTESAQSPPIPEEGLPAGWTIEQWQYYGQQYLDRIGK